MAAFLVGIALVYATPLVAQTEVKIMVNGPFDYVVDPYDSKRIVVMAPKSHYHYPVQVFSGDDAAEPSTYQTGSLPEGFFSVDFTGQTSYNGPSHSTPVVYQVANISTTVIANAVCKHSATGCTLAAPRYAISLPKPDYYTTFYGGFGGSTWTGLSQSIISPSKITSTTMVPDSRAEDYTTWMVLHYSVSAIPAKATLTGETDDGTPFPSQSIQFSSYNQNTPIKAISIIQMGFPEGNGAQCDTYSHESFDRSNGLWQLSLYALFPQLDGQGAKSSQIRDAFDYTCVYSAQNSAKNIKAVKSKTMPPMQAAAAGSADCHKAQMSINGVVINN
jgi:hypothetical protein